MTVGQVSAEIYSSKLLYSLVPMRINKFIAQQLDISRRKADLLIEQGVVSVNRQPAHAGMRIAETDVVIADGKKLQAQHSRPHVTLLLHKPTGYVCSKDGQGSPTIYELLPPKYQSLYIAGRLDKDSSGLVILTNDGELMQTLTHPSQGKKKTYQVGLATPLTEEDIQHLKTGVIIGEERISQLIVTPAKKKSVTPTYTVQMHEGRNRQIRRTFEALGNQVLSLHRTDVGPYSLETLRPKQCKLLTDE